MSSARLGGTRFTVVATAVVVVAVMVTAVYLLRPEQAKRVEPLAQVTSAPPDLQQYRSRFLEGIQAVQEGDGQRAVERLSSFSFGQRDVEEYRLFYLATALQLRGDVTGARVALAALWRKNPRLVYRHDVAFTLGTLYAQAADWHQASEIYGMLAARTDRPEVAAVARGEYITTKFYAGDPGAILLAARNTLIESPAAPQAAAARALYQSLGSIPPDHPIPLTPAERLTRAENLLEAGKNTDALGELIALGALDLPSSTRDEVVFNRGLALQRLSRFEESNKVLETLSGGQYRFAVPALFRSSLNYQRLAAAINPERYKTIKIKTKSGTRKVKRKGKIVRVPVYKTTTKQVKYIDAAAAAKKQGYDKLESERLKDVLLVPSSREIRMPTLLRLVDKATQRNQDDYLRSILPELVKLDPSTDLALQRFWGRGWDAFVRGDLTGAEREFSFIEATYRNPNVRRQARYWYARTIERAGRRDEAKQIYQQLAASPYEDLYAKFSVSRGATEPARPPRRLAELPDDWNRIAEKVFPADLRLAYELTALGATREARTEVQANANDANRPYADMILGELYYSSGALVLAHRFLRRAYPALHTVEQDQVPVHFLKMYYPVRWDEVIRARAEKRGVDPYLLMALIHQESGFDPYARSSVGATGLMQLMPGTGKELARKLHGPFTDPHLEDPVVSIDLGSFYIGQLIQMFNGNVELAVAGYNGGPYRIKAWRNQTRGPLDQFIEGLPLTETRNYVKRVTILRSSYARFDPH